MNFKNKYLHQWLLILAMLPMLIVSIKCVQKILSYSDQRKVLKQDYSDINSIRYGLLSVDKWRDNVAELVAQQIDQFKLNGKQEDSLKEFLNETLNALITQADEMMQEKKKGFGEKIKKFAYNAFVDVDKVRAKIPEFSQTIIDEIKDPKNKRKLKFLANDKLEEMAEQTKDNIVEQSDYEKLIAKYGGGKVSAINENIAVKSDQLMKRMYICAFQILGIMLIFLLTWILIRKQRYLYKPLFVMSIILAVVILLVGIGSPMIEIDARIKEVNFLLLNKNIQFSDQVLFFQSKSILDVVHILIQTHKPDSVFVGLLILLFSVVFPISKLLATEIYLLGKEKWKSNAVIQFFAFKSGKWSMADVMVVAIFMAYVGFNGILTNQLEILNVKNPTFTSIATNNTSLQPGFILFIAFVLYGLVLSEILKKITSKYSSI